MVCSSILLQLLLSLGVRKVAVAGMRRSCAAVERGHHYTDDIFEHCVRREEVPSTLVATRFVDFPHALRKMRRQRKEEDPCRYVYTLESKNGLVTIGVASSEAPIRLGGGGASLGKAWARPRDERRPQQPRASLDVAKVIACVRKSVMDVATTTAASRDDDPATILRRWRRAVRMALSVTSRMDQTDVSQFTFAMDSVLKDAREKLQRGELSAEVEEDLEDLLTSARCRIMSIWSRIESLDVSGIEDRSARRGKLRRFIALRKREEQARDERIRDYISAGGVDDGYDRVTDDGRREQLAVTWLQTMRKAGRSGGKTESPEVLKDKVRRAREDLRRQIAEAVAAEMQPTGMQPTGMQPGAADRGRCMHPREGSECKFVPSGLLPGVTYKRWTCCRCGEENIPDDYMHS